MNQLDDLPIDTQSFAYNDLIGQDRWFPFTPSFSLTVVGTPTYVGRYRIIGSKMEFQVSAVATTSIASTAGTHYLTLPRMAKGIGGVATMTNNTTNIAVGVCHIDTATSRCYLPTQAASGDTFNIAGSFEIGL